jgi:hypothetical protein
VVIFFPKIIILKVLPPEYAARPLIIRLGTKAKGKVARMFKHDTKVAYVGQGGKVPHMQVYQILARVGIPTTTLLTTASF